MNNSKVKTVNRILSMVLAFVMVVGLVPVTVFASTSTYPSDFTVTVTDNNYSMIDEVDVFYEIFVDNVLDKSGNVSTTDGEVVIPNMADYSSDISDGKTVELSYTISKSGYISKSEKIPVTDVTANINVTLDEDSSFNTDVTVVVMQEGNGTVELNGIETNTITLEEGSNVNIKLTPATDAYVKEVRIDDIEQTVDNNSCFETTVSVSADMIITVSFVNTFNVSVSKNADGSVLIDSEDVSNKAYDENSTVSVSITPNQGYQISSVSIGGISETVSDVNSFTKSFTVTNHTNIVVEFVKIYTVQLYYNSTQGSVVTMPECEGGSVSVRDGANVSITATPNETYRVSKVSITGRDNVVPEGNIYNKDNPYTTSLTADKDYMIEIEFAPLIFNVTKSETIHGSVSLSKQEVSYGEDFEVTITPDAGYTIDTVTVNENDVTSQISETDVDNDSVLLNVSNVTENKNVVVTFKSSEPASVSDITWNSDEALRTTDDGKTFIFEENKEIVFSTDKQGIKITFGDNTTVGGKNIKSVTISDTKTITKIELRYDFGWHEVEIDDESVNWRIIIDDAITEPVITPTEPNSYGYYNDNVSITVHAEDSGDYSGLESVEYWITCDGVQKERDFLYYYNDGDNIKSKCEEEISVDADENNSDNVVVYVKAVDRAGNESTKSVNLKINATKPTVSVSIDGTLHEEAQAGYYNNTRTATVTIIDRASCFDENKANEGIEIIAKDAHESPVAISKASMISSWTNNGDTHTATITFSSDAVYNWDVSYTNKAGMTNEGKASETGDSIYEFTVDKTAPGGKITVDTKEWYEIQPQLTIDICRDYSLDAKAEGYDETSPIYDIKYYKSNADYILGENELVELYNNGAFTSDVYTVSSDEQFVVYARITDYAGNTRYIGTNGVIVDMTDSDIIITPDEPNSNGFYNSDFNVSIVVNEEVFSGVAYSGIKTVSYRIVANEGTEHEVITQKETTIYPSDTKSPTANQLKKDFSDVIVVDSEKNNYDNVKVVVTVVDNAENEYTERSDSLSINTVEPTISVSFGGDKANRVEDGRGYFGQKRTATVTVTDRASTFNETNATKSITEIIQAVDVNGENISTLDTSEMIGEWTHDGDTHTVTVTFAENGNYTWSLESLSYTNDADVSNTPVNTDGCVTPSTFTVDCNDKPFGSITIETKTWADELLEKLTFGLYKNEKVAVSATAGDNISPVTIEYYKTSDSYALKEDILNEKKFEPFEGSDIQKNGVSPNEQFVIYLKITDYAGNFIYVSSDGYIVDDVPSEIIFAADTPNKNGIYNKDVNVDVKVTDQNPYSGIKTISYWIESDNVKTKENNPFTFDVKDPTQEELVNEQNVSLTVDAESNNSCNVVVFVKTVDNAENEKVESVPLDIDVTAPSIKISYKDKANLGAKTGYFTERTATVVITERTHHFDETAATKGIVITATDAKGNKIEDAYTISSWTTKEGSTPDESTHTATIRFRKDANYTFAIAYTDKAGNPNTTPDVTGQTAPYKFTVDTTAPVGTVTATSAEGRTETWSSLIDTLTFGFWSNKKISITGTSSDVTSSVASVQYYMPTAEKANDKTTALNKSALDKVTAWENFSAFDVTTNAQFTVYIKIMDRAGNYIYISTNGLIVDDQHPIEESVAPEITVTPEQPINGIYNGDVKVSITVVDPMVGGTYSGLKEITYKVFDRNSSAPNQATQEGTLYSFSNSNPKQSDLLKSWSGEITVDSSKNNSNNIQIVVYAVDNTGNAIDNSQKESKSYTSIKIDTTAPVIDISYNNNSTDSNDYFKNDRVATIKVTERNFEASDVKITITNTDGVIPSVTGWSDISGTNNQDNSTHTATISYTADGDYTFAIEYTDLAGNKCTSINYADGTVAGTEFTVDKTVPTITVTYDNNSAQNNNYYKEARTATVVINEHNFSTDRITVTMTATDNGVKTTVPAVNGWSTNGNTHTATINYTDDALYSFQITYTDLAGNKAADYEKDTFYVDKTAPEIEITGVSDKSANNGDIAPVITITDTNFNKNAVSIILNGVNNGNNLDYNRSYENVVNGQKITYSNFEKVKELDDLYTLTATLTDMAGNETTQTITFSANRFGSVYDMSAVKEMTGKYLKTEENIVFMETNVDSLEKGTIKIKLIKNGVPTDLVEGTDYTIIETGGNGEWSQYQYTINKELFADDGKYSISIYSVDAAGNVNENIDEVKDAEISFGIDKTNPVVVPIDLENGTQYNLETKKVSVEIKDNLVLEGVKIYLNDKEVNYTVNEETYTFDIPQSNSLQKVRIVAVDSAGNETEILINDFLVSTNFFVRWYNNTPLFIISLCVIGVVVIGIIAFFVFGRRKSEEK